MKKFLERLIGKREVLKKFSLTSDPATVGSDAKRDLDPETGPLIDRLQKGDVINNSEMNKLAQFYFNVKEIPGTCFKFNTGLLEGMTFDIIGVETETNEVNDVVNIRLNMREVVYNVDLSMKISVKDFHEFLLPINPVES